MRMNLRMTRLLTTTPYPNKEDLELLYYLMKKGFNLSNDANWMQILETAKAEVKAKREAFTIRQITMNDFLGKKMKTWKDIGFVLSRMIKSKQTAPEIVHTVRSLLLANTETNFHVDMAIVFRQLTILSSTKDEELIKKLEPEFLKHLGKMELHHFESILKGFKLWNYISEPIYAKLIQTVIQSPDKYELEELTYLMHVLETQGIYNPKFFSQVHKHINTELKKAWELSAKELLNEFPAVSAGMYLATLLKLKLLNTSTIQLVERIVLKYLNLNEDVKALTSLLTTHTTWIGNNLSEDRGKYFRNKRWIAYSEEFYNKVVVRFLELKEKLKGTEIMTIITSATIGGIKKKDNAITVLQLAAEGFKKLQSREEYESEKDLNTQRVILLTDLYNQAKKYCNSAQKKKILNDSIKDTEIKHFVKP